MACSSNSLLCVCYRIIHANAVWIKRETHVSIGIILDTYIYTITEKYKHLLKRQLCNIGDLTRSVKTKHMVFMCFFIYNSHSNGYLKVMYYDVMPCVMRICIWHKYYVWNVRFPIKKILKFYVWRNIKLSLLKYI